MPKRQISCSDFIFLLYQTSKDFTVHMNIYEDGLCHFPTDMSIIVQLCHIRMSKGPMVPNVSRPQRAHLSLVWHTVYLAPLY